MLDGSDSPQTEKVREFVTRLENKARSMGFKLTFVFQDERFTTKIAENVLIEADMSRKKRKEIIDRQAAVVILQSYLDKLRIAEGPEAIDREFDRILPVVRQGGYIVGADHQVPPSASIDNYRYYIKRLKEVMQECGKDL